MLNLKFIAGLLCAAIVTVFNTGCFKMTAPELKNSGTNASTTSTDPNVSFSCNLNAAPVVDTVMRLTVPQYQNTVYALVLAGLNASDAATFSSLYATTLSGISFPNEGSYGLGNAMIYDTEDQGESLALVQAQYKLSYAMASYIASSSARLSQFVNSYAAAGSCPAVVPNTGVSQGCYDAFIKGFGIRSLRRPVQSANNPIDSGTSNPAAANDLTYYEGVYTDSTNGGFDSLITVMMMAPDSAFLTEFAGTISNTTGSSTQVALSNYEIASKMAYYYTNAPPDTALMTAAQAGFTGPGNTIANQSSRLFASSLARPRFSDFYTQWIRPAAIPALTVSSNSPSTDPAALSTLRTNAIQELVDLTKYYTFGVSVGHASDLLSSPISFAKTNDLASLYNVNVWPGPNADGSYNQNTLVSFPATSPRAGMFTRAAYAFSGARDNNPIIRGARIWKDYFCQDLTPPAAFTLATNLAVNGPPTVRNIVVANTQNPGSACVSCHGNIINPLGFALENYDSFGRYRLLEPIFNADGTMNYSTNVNAQSQPFLPFNNPTQVSDPVTYSQDLGATAAFNSCFVRHYFRYSQGRREDDTADGCRLNQMMNALTNSANTGSIQAMINSVPSGSYFQTRNITP